MKIEEVKNVIRDIVDFPQKGIVFKDGIQEPGSNARHQRGIEGSL